MIRDSKTYTAHAIEKDDTKVKTSFTTTSLDPGFILWEFVAFDPLPFYLFLFCLYHC